MVLDPQYRPSAGLLVSSSCITDLLIITGLSTLGGIVKKIAKEESPNCCKSTLLGLCCFLMFTTNFIMGPLVADLLLNDDKGNQCRKKTRTGY